MPEEAPVTSTVFSSDDELHKLFGVSDGSHLVHDFLFADGGIGRAAAGKAIEQLLAGLCMPGDLADEFTEQRLVHSRHVHVNALHLYIVSCCNHNKYVFELNIRMQRYYFFCNYRSHPSIFYILSQVLQDSVLVSLITNAWCKA